jgi:hypothetical protein
MEKKMSNDIDTYLNILNEQQEEVEVGKHRFMTDDQFDPKELTMGIEVEYEHTDNPLIAKEIAKDHLAECSTYYTRLKKMEDECQQQGDGNE